MRAVLLLAAKDLRLMARDKMALFWALGFPLIMALFFGVISGGGGERGRMRIGVEDADGTPGSRAFVDRLKKSDALEVIEAPAAEARDRVRRGNLVAYLLVRKGFGEASLFGGPDRPKLLEVGIDPARTAEAGYLEGLLTQASFAGLGERFGDPAAMRGDLKKQLADLSTSGGAGGGAGAGGMTPAQRANLTQLLGDLDRFFATSEEAEKATGAQPMGMPFQPTPIDKVSVLRAGAQPSSPFEVTFPSGILWGIIGCVATFAIGMVKERTRGTLARLRVAPMSFAQILAGKAAACFAACVAVVVVLLVFASLIFKVRLANPPALAAAIVCTAVCFVGIMMFLSVLGKTESAVAGASWGFMLPLSMIGGGMIPLIAMPRWMLSISDLSPVKWGIYALEGAIWRDFSPAEMVLPCAILLAVGAAFFTAGVFLSRRFV
jgi:ABC-2 type transport system permease protein